MKAPKRVKDVRRLAGCVAALSRFISKSAEHALPFFKILKKAGPMTWTPKAEAALQDLKKYLSSAHVVVAPKPEEPLTLYLAATNQVVSTPLVAKRETENSETMAPEPTAIGPRPTPMSQELNTEATREAKQRAKKVVQQPVYFVSSLLQGARSKYSCRVGPGAGQFRPEL